MRIFNALLFASSAMMAIGGAPAQTPTPNPAVFRAPAFASVFGKDCSGMFGSAWIVFRLTDEGVKFWASITGDTWRVAHPTATWVPEMTTLNAVNANGAFQFTTRRGSVYVVHVDGTRIVGTATNGPSFPVSHACE